MKFRFVQCVALSLTLISKLGLSYGQILEKTCKDHEDLPVSGFLLAQVELENEETPHFSLAFKIESRVSIVSECRKIQFLDAPAFLENTIFDAQESDPVNGRMLFSNGQYYLSFVSEFMESRPHGTWILGNIPGEDNGIAYIKAPHMNLVPLFETGVEAVAWHWIDKDGWQAMNTSTVCIDESTDLSLIFEAQYIEKEQPIKTSIIQRADGSLTFWNVEHKRWIPMEIMDKKAEDDTMSSIHLGEPFWVKDNQGASCTGHLVNSEFLYTHWRLMFHCHNHNATEVFLYYDKDGLMHHSSISALDAPNLYEYKSGLQTSLLNARKGEFFWLWFKPQNGSFLKTADILVRCVSNLAGTVSFLYYDSDRRTLMKRSLLSYLTKMLIVSSTGTSFTASLGNTPIDIVGALVIGSDPILWVKGYLERYEGSFGGMSSCFLYHGAISMPQQLIYLAEVVCLLIGSKPVTMIQYSSSSDHQWKFPLTYYVTQHIITFANSVPNFEIDYRINRYGNEETLVLYHKNHEDLAAALLPLNQAQALHIVPYPENLSADGNRNIYEAQVYNSWWNGHLLGYPESFIDQYCLSLQSNISRAEKELQIEKARDDWTVHAKNLKPVQIRQGLNPPVISDFWDTLHTSMLGNTFL